MLLNFFYHEYPLIGPSSLVLLDLTYLFCHFFPGGGPSSVLHTYIPRRGLPRKSKFFVNFLVYSQWLPLLTSPSSSSVSTDLLTATQIPQITQHSLLPQSPPNGILFHCKSPSFSLPYFHTSGIRLTSLLVVSADENTRFRSALCKSEDQEAEEHSIQLKETLRHRYV